MLLGDDLMIDNAKVLTGMIETYERTASSVVALRDVPADQIQNYGCADPGDRTGDLVQIKGLVEKPEPAKAPSTLAVMGRYIFGPEIFEALERVKPGVGGEIQLTDAIAGLLSERSVYGYVFSEGRYDIGSKQDYLRAMVELALARDDLGPEFERFLVELLRDRGSLGG